MRSSRYATGPRIACSRPQIGLFAINDIPADTELSYECVTLALDSRRLRLEDFCTHPLTLRLQKQLTRLSYGFQAFSTLQTPSKKKAKADSDETDHAADQRCHCGAAKCRGWLSGRKHEVEAVKGGGGRGRKR